MGFFNVLFEGGSATSDAADAEALRLKEILLRSPKITDVKIVKTPNKSAHIFEIRYLSDGLKIVGFFGFPRGFSLDQKYPLLMFNHGGSREYGKIVPERFAMHTSAYLEHGYAVCGSQYRGVGGSQGKEEWGGRDVHDVLNLLEISQSFSFIDEYNSFMLGMSRGGMMTHLAIRSGARINAAAVFAGIADLARIHKDNPDQFKIHKDIIPGFVRNRDQVYRDRSAIFWPEKINVPMLLLHGSADKIVSVSQSIDLEEKMSKLGKVVELKIYRGGGHDLHHYPLDYRIDVLRWFKKYSSRGSGNFYPYTDAALDRRPYDYASGLTKKYNDPSLLSGIPYDVSTGVKTPYDHTTGDKQSYDVITGKTAKTYDHVTGDRQPYDLATGHKRPYDPITGNDKPLPTRRQKLFGMWPWK